MNREAIADTLQSICLGEPCEVRNGLGGEIQANIDPDQLRAVTLVLLERHDVRHLSTITALNNVEGGVELLYHFWQHGGLTLRVHCPSERLALASLVDVIPGADWYEREVHDLFGVEFVGHPNLSPLLLADDWSGPPPLLDLGREEE